jgi:hypothetical protein
MEFQSQNVRLEEPGASTDLSLVVLNEGRYSFNYRFLQTVHMSASGTYATLANEV